MGVPRYHAGCGVPAKRLINDGSCYKACVLTQRDGDPTLLQRELRRRWFYLLPAVFVTYSLAYLDRANYGFGAAAGLAKTLHITNSQTALLGSLFFLGYFFFQVPGIAYARRTSASRLVFYSLILWGVLAALTGVIRQFWLLAIDRLLLGVAESLIFPAMLILITNWFTREERSRANAILILGNPITVLWMSAATGYLIKAVGWQMAFVIEGLPSVLVGVRLVLRGARSSRTSLVVESRLPATTLRASLRWNNTRFRRNPASSPRSGCRAFSCSACSSFAGAWAFTASCCGCRRSFARA